MAWRKRDIRKQRLANPFSNVRAITRMARKQKYLVEDPGEDVTMPLADSAEKPVMAREQILALLGAIEDAHDLCLMHLVTFQVMRRTMGTDMQHHGTLKDTQGALRHASIKTTGDVYVQVRDESVARAVSSRTAAILAAGQLPLKSWG